MKHDKLTKGFPKMVWRYADGVLWAKEFVRRTPFGNFDIYLEQNPSIGTVTVWIGNKDYPILNISNMSYESFEKALSGITAYFNDIAEKSKNIPPEVELRAKQAYQKIIADEIAKMVAKGD